MELNKEHRSALLASLETAQKELATAKTVQAAYVGGEVLAFHYDVDIYLAMSRIHAIETAIVDNELYNY